MSQNHHTPKPRKFQHLKFEDKVKIELLLEQKVKITEISRELGISHSTLYKELNRGAVEQIDTNLNSYRKYYDDAGQMIYKANRKNSRKPLKTIENFLFSLICRERNFRKQQGT